jgi:hypothetical protein
MGRCTLNISSKTEEITTIDLVSYGGTFGEGVTALKEEGLELITTQDLAEARILGGPNTVLSKCSACTSEGIIYLPERKEYLVVDRINNPILRKPMEASAAESRDRLFYPEQEVVDELRGQARRDGKNGVLLLPRKEIKDRIPVEALADKPLTRFLFRNLAEEYGRFLKSIDSNNIGIDIAALARAGNERQNFARVLELSPVREKRECWQEASSFCDSRIQYTRLNYPLNRYCGLRRSRNNRTSAKWNLIRPKTIPDEYDEYNQRTDSFHGSPPRDCESGSYTPLYRPRR